MSEFTISFDSKTKLQQFQAPFKKINFAEENGIVVHFSDKKIEVHATSNTSVILSQILIDNEKVFGEVDIPNPTEIGLIEFSKFLSCLDMFSENFKVHFDGSKFTLTGNDNSSIEYHTANTDLINECKNITPKKFGEPISVFSINDRSITKIIKAFSILNQDLLKVSGKKGESVVKLSITNKGLSNSYNMEVESTKPNTKDFEMYYSQEHLMNMLKGDVKNVDVMISEKALIGNINADAYNMVYYISRKGVE